MKSKYKPTKNIHKDRVLLAFSFGPDGEKQIKNPVNKIGFPDGGFVGEARHPTAIIFKDNEVGAYGIGTDILANLAKLKSTSIRLATKKEIAAALELKEVEITWKVEWPKA